MSLVELRPTLPVLTGNFDAFWRYRTEPQPVRIAMFRATEPFPPTEPVADEDLGWRALGHVDVRIVSGRHHTVVREPHAAILAEQLRASLADARAKR